MVGVAAAYGIKAALIQSQVAVAAAAAAQIKTAIDLEYGVAKESMDRVFRVDRVCDTIEKAIMLTLAVVEVAQVVQVITAWIVTMMELQQTAARVLPVTL